MSEDICVTLAHVPRERPEYVYVCIDIDSSYMSIQAIVHICLYNQECVYIVHICLYNVCIHSSYISIQDDLNMSMCVYTVHICLYKCIHSSHMSIQARK